MRFTAVLLLALLPLVSYSQDRDHSGVTGYWLSENGEYIVEIQQADGVLSGTIVWLADRLDAFGQPMRDVMNQEPEMRSRPVVGIAVLRDFVRDDDKWDSGKIYDIRSGNTYNGKLRLDDNGNLRVTGFYGILFFLGKTKHWTRVDDISEYHLK